MKSIKTKIMVILGGVMLVGLMVSGIFVVQFTGKTVMASEEYIVSGSTDTIVADVNTYFQKYIATTQQLARDLMVSDLVTSGVTSETVTQAPNFYRIRGMMESAAASDPDRAASYFVGSGLANLAFNETDWIADMGTYDLTQKSYGFNSAESLSKGVIITDPYQDAVTGNMVVTISAPIYSSTGQYVGVIGADLQITAVNEMVTKAKSTYKTGYQVLISDTNEVLAHRDQEAVLKSVDEIGYSQPMLDAIKNSKESVVQFDDNGVPSCGVVREADFTGWKVLSVVPEKEFYQAVNGTKTTLLIIYSICFILLIAAIFLVASNIVAPLKKLTKVTDELAKGNLDAQIDIRSKDEVGRLADSMKALTARLSTYITYIEEVSAALDDFGRGNLNIHLEQAYDGEFEQLKTSMLQTAEVFRQTIGELVHISDKVSSGSDQVASGAQMLAQGTTEQASSVQELSATIQEISNNVKQNAANARTAADQVKTVGDAADRSNAQMTQMVGAIQQINEKSTEIGKIIKTIDDIAFQTNILALNAAVEAARAGAAGKGFAVVADEVRNLASKSAEAAKVTTALIEDSVRAVENGTVIADETSHMLTDVLQGVTQTVGLISEISKASATQADTIAQIALGIDQISAVVQTNSATAEESSAASDELAGQATMLKGVSGKFRL